MGQSEGSEEWGHHSRCERGVELKDENTDNREQDQSMSAVIYTWHSHSFKLCEVSLTLFYVVSCFLYDVTDVFSPLVPFVLHAPAQLVLTLSVSDAQME